MTIPQLLHMLDGLYDKEEGLVRELSQVKDDIAFLEQTIIYKQKQIRRKGGYN